MANSAKYLDKTLQQLLDIKWTAENTPTDEDSNVVRRGYSVTLKQLKDFTYEDVRFCLSQEIGLIFVVPMAIDILNNDILAEGHMYPGDIVRNLLRVDAEFWNLHTDLALEVKRVCTCGLEQLLADQELDGHIKNPCIRMLEKLLSAR